MEESIGLYGWETVVEMFLKMERLVLERNSSLDLLKVRRSFLQADLLTAMGLQAFLGFDGDVLAFLRQSGTTDYPSFKRRLEEHIVEGVRQQLERGGSTVLLDIEQLQGRADTASLVPKILKLREQEASDVLLCRIGDEVDLTPLWVTHAGHEVLSSLKYENKFVADRWHRTHGLVVHPVNGAYKKMMKAVGRAGVRVRYTDRPEEAAARLSGISRPFLRYVLAQGTGEYMHGDWHEKEARRRGVAFLDAGWDAFQN